MHLENRLKEGQVISFVACRIRSGKEKENVHLIMKIFPLNNQRKTRVSRKSNGHTILFSTNDVGATGYLNTREFTYILFITCITDLNVLSKPYSTHNKIIELSIHNFELGKPF